MLLKVVYDSSLILIDLLLQFITEKVTLEWPGS